MSVIDCQASVDPDDGAQVNGVAEMEIESAPTKGLRPESIY